MIKRPIQIYPPVSSNQIQKQFCLAVSARKIRRRAVEAGLFCRRPVRKPFISTKNRKTRLDFATAHLDLSIQKWNTILFSDESTETSNPKHCVAIIKYSGGNVMVWG